jgi:putative ABC transport system permease protein
MLSLMVYASMLAVVCILIGQWLSYSLNQHFERSGAEALGSDRVVSYSQPLSGDWWDQAQVLPLQRSHSVVFHTMAYRGDEMQLVRVRAIDDQFPLRGLWQREPSKPISPGQIWLDEAAMQSLGASLGDAIELGSLKLVVAGVSIAEPNAQGQGFWFAPKVVVHSSDLESIGTIGPGSRVRYYQSLAGESAALAQLDVLAEQLPDNWNYRSATQNDGQGRNWLDYAQRLINLSVAAITLLCFYTLLVAVKGYLLAQRRLLVVYRTFGADRRRCFGLVYQLLVVSLLGASVVGALIASALYFLAYQIWPQWLSFDGPMLGALYWLLLPLMLVALLAYPGTKALLDIPPRRLLSAAIPTTFMTAIWLLLSAAVVVWLIRDWRWALWLIGALSLIWLTSSLLRRGLVKLLGLLPITQVSWRLALLRLRQHGNTSDTMLVGLVLALGLTASVWVLQQRLINQWLTSLPTDAPNYFLINMDPQFTPDIWSLAGEQKVVLSPPFEVIRGRLSAVNGEELCRDDCTEEQRQAPDRELNFTYSDTLPQTNEVVAGQWLSEIDAPSVSVEQGFAERTKIVVGDTLTFSIYGSELSLPVTSIRTLDWRSLKPNFFVIFSPSALTDYPGMVMASAYVPEDNDSFLNELRSIDAAVTAIDISQWLVQTRQLLEQLALGVRTIALLLILAAALLLSTQLMMSLSQRRKEIAVMRLLGATRRQLGQSLLLELALLGSVSGVIALVASEGLAIGLGQLFELQWQPSWLGWGAVLVSGPVVVVLAAMGFIAQLNNAKGWKRQAEYD